MAVSFVGGAGAGFCDVVVVVIAAAVATVAGEVLYFCLLFSFPVGTTVPVVRFVRLGCCCWWFACFGGSTGVVDGGGHLRDSAEAPICVVVVVVGAATVATIAGAVLYF